MPPRTKAKPESEVLSIEDVIADLRKIHPQGQVSLIVTATGSYEVSVSHREVVVATANR